MGFAPSFHSTVTCVVIPLITQVTLPDSPSLTSTLVGATAVSLRFNYLYLMVVIWKVFRVNDRISDFSKDGLGCFFKHIK